MILAFTLSMPGAASWDGKWSGEGTLYCITRSFSGSKGGVQAAEILDSAPYSYGWSDGWRASIAVSAVDSRLASKLRKKSRGFCGYDWMVNTIISHGRPLARHELAETVAVKP